MDCKPARYTTIENPTPPQMAIKITDGMARFLEASHSSGWLIRCSFNR
jgi:hypothetical protein